MSAAHNRSPKNQDPENYDPKNYDSENEESKGLNGPDDLAFSELLTRLIRVGNQLALAPSVDELCRLAVVAGLNDLGFERMSIWLLSEDGQLLRGTYGTDEQGHLRDERTKQRPLSEKIAEMRRPENRQRLYRTSQVPLYNESSEVVGTGDAGVAALWNGKEIIGLLYADNFLSRQPLREEQWRVLELYASTLGHLLSLKRTESALRSNEELLSQILEILPVGVFVLSPEEGIVRFNRVGQEIWEFDAESLAHWSPEALWVGEHRAVQPDEWAGKRALWHGESTLNQEIEIVRKDGTRRVLLNSSVPLRNAQGALTGAVVLNQDITESKRYEQQLEARTRMADTLRPLAGLQDVLQAIVSELMRILHAEGVAIVLGGAEGALSFNAADGDFSLLAGEEAPRDFADFKSDGSSSLRMIDAAVEMPWNVYQKLAHIPRYSLVVPLIAQSSVIGFVLVGLAEQPDQPLLSLINVLADVAVAAIQRGQLYDEVTTQAFRLERVMESVNFGLVLLDSQQRIVLANQRARTKLQRLAHVAVGEELHELGGKNLDRFLTPDGGPSHMQEINDEDTIFEITTVPVGAEGIESGYLIVIRDVTRERSFQLSVQQHQRLAAVGQLAAGIAHDFNNIIAVILLYVQMLQRNPSLGESAQKRLNVIGEQAQHAARLVRQIMDFSRQTVIEREIVDLHKLAKDGVALWRRTLPETISLRLSSALEGPAPIFADASSIQQVLTNLAVNARDAMPNGGELTIRLRDVTVGEEDNPPVTGLKPGCWFEVSVMDTGLGIAPEHLPHVFDPFFTTKEIGKGTGLGLAQVYGIIQQHGGVVTAQSEVGKGTSISLFLPAMLGNEPVAQEVDAPAMPQSGSETILLVEDNAPAREATKSLLEMMGYDVLVAANGREGLEIFHQHRDKIQLLLSDLVMPEMGGVQLYQQIRSENPAVNFIIMTGYPLEVEGESHQLAAQEGVEWLQKPFTIKQLTETVQRVLDREKRTDEEQMDEE